MVKYNEKELDNVFHALSDRTRRNMIERLSSGYHSASDLARDYSITFPAVSKHLRVLEKADLVKVQKRGRQRIFNVNSSQLEEARIWMQHWSRFWNIRLDKLEKFLSKNN